MASVLVEDAECFSRREDAECFSRRENAKCPSWRGAPKVEDGKCASCRPGGSEGEDAVKRDLRAILIS